MLHINEREYLYDALKSFNSHIKDASESVFYFLQGLQEHKTVLLNPTKQECERYITSDDMIIVRTLINEAPVVSMQNYFFPTLEKILVDAAGDKELLYTQGAELFTIYENASKHTI